MKKLCLLAISYNEEKHIKFWIDNHREFVDEIILVDTGSTDNTVKIAKENNIKVFNYRWQHHFAHAKNFALGYCNTECHPDWIFFMSPDFWVSNDDMKKIRKAIEKDDFDAYRTRKINHPTGWFDFENTTVSKTQSMGRLQIVLYRNDPAIFYMRRVHELVNISLEMAKKRIGYLDITRHHDDTCIKEIERDIYFDALTEGDWSDMHKLDLLRKNYR